MKKKLKIIPLDSIELIDLSDLSPSDPDLPDNPNPDKPSSFPSLSPEFSFLPSPLPGSGTSLPSSEVEFAFPAEDYKRVQAWFSGDFSHVVTPESPTLKKNMRAAVINTLDRFAAAAAGKNLLTAPCRIGWRYRLFDGSFIYPDTPILLSPDYAAPLLIITGYNLYEKFLHTDVTFSRNPSSILFALPVPERGPEFADIITAVEFFISRQSELYSSDAEVAGIRTSMVDGTRERIWHYEAYEPEEVEAAAKAASDFRLVASIPFSEILNGIYAEPTAFPLEAGTLGRLSSLPKVTIPAKTSTSSSSSSAASASSSDSLLSSWRPFLHFHTAPLNLSLPETAKSVCDLYLRGVFERSEVELTLYGSHHREHWRLLAKSRGPYIRGLRRTPYRWLRVEVSLPMRRNDFLDSLVFHHD